MSPAIVFLLASVFALAAGSKMRSLHAFRAVLRKLMPVGWDKTLAQIIPVGELLLAAILLSGFAPHWAAGAAILVLAVFTAFLLRMRRIGLKGCACFGEESNATAAATGIARNLILILGAMWVAARPDSVRIWSQNLATLTGQATVVLGALCLWPCVVALVNRLRFLRAEVQS